MFGNTINCLPSCNNYEGAARLWERRPVPRNKKNWPDGTRPLDDARKQHYAVVKDGDRYFFKLYRTNVVVWHSPDHITLDSSYDSAATRNFADRYLPYGIGFGYQREEKYTVKTRDAEFCRGIHEFRFCRGEWHVDSPTRKPTRTVLDPHEKKRIQAALKPLREWVKGLWALSGDDGSHPWVGKEVGDLRYPIPRFDLTLLSAGDIPEMEKVLMHMLPIRWTRFGQKPLKTYMHMGATDLLAQINRRIYRQEGAHIQIDYDAPLPRLKEKK